MNFKFQIIHRLWRNLWTQLFHYIKTIIKFFNLKIFLNKNQFQKNLKFREQVCKVLNRSWETKSYRVKYLYKKIIKVKLYPSQGRRVHKRNDDIKYYVILIQFLTNWLIILINNSISQWIHHLVNFKCIHVTT